MRRKPRIRADQRASKSTEWRTAVDSAVAELERNKDTSAMSISDFDRLDQALATTREISKVVFGEVAPAIRPLQRSHSNAEARITRKLRLLRTARRNILRCMSRTDRSPTSAIKKVRSMNIRPGPAWYSGSAASLAPGQPGFDSHRSHAR